MHFIGTITYNYTTRFINNGWKKPIMHSGRKKSQAWSIDLMLALVIFIGVIFIAYSILGPNKDENAKNLVQDAGKVLDRISAKDSEISIVDGTVVNETKLLEFLAEDYPDLKEKLRADSDFCIFLEDEDGKVIYISSNKPGIGSDKIKISNEPCD